MEEVNSLSWKSALFQTRSSGKNNKFNVSQNNLSLYI